MTWMPCVFQEHTFLEGGEYPVTVVVNNTYGRLVSSLTVVGDSLHVGHLMCAGLEFTCSPLHRSAKFQTPPKAVDLL